jgi:hypothetical protein
VLPRPCCPTLLSGSGLWGGCPTLLAGSTARLHCMGWLSISGVPRLCCCRPTASVASVSITTDLVAAVDATIAAIVCLGRLSESVTWNCCPSRLSDSSVRFRCTTPLHRAAARLNCLVRLLTLPSSAATTTATTVAPGTVYYSNYHYNVPLFAVDCCYCSATSMIVAAVIAAAVIAVFTVAAAEFATTEHCRWCGRLAPQKSVPQVGTTGGRCSASPSGFVARLRFPLDCRPSCTHDYLIRHGCSTHLPRFVHRFGCPTQHVSSTQQGYLTQLGCQISMAVRLTLAVDLACLPDSAWLPDSVLLPDLACLPESELPPSPNGRIKTQHSTV